MLLIKTYLAKSKTEGLGLFADEDVKKGKIVWKFNPKIDITITKKGLTEFPEITQEFLKKYSSLSKISNKYILSADDTRFINHSSKPNLNTRLIAGEPELVSFANRNIKKGEEFTIDYREFDQVSERSEEEYLNR